MESQLIFKRDGWVPCVMRTRKGFALDVPVASGHAHYTCTFQLTSAQAEVLCKDAERYYFLYAAMHVPLQRGPDQLGQAAAQDMMATILEGTQGAAEQMLTALDHDSNGAVSNLVRICMNRDQAPMRRGRWFMPSDS